MNSPVPPSSLCQDVQALLNQYWLQFGQAPHSLNDREEALARLSQQIHARILEEHAQTDQKQLEPKPCDCGCAFTRYEQQRERTLVTTVAALTLKRDYYVCPGCSATCLPLDRAWGLEGRGCLSPRAHQQLSELSAAVPYAEAHHFWVAMDRPQVSPSTVWRTTQKAGAKLLSEFEATKKVAQTKEGCESYLKAMRGPGIAGRHLLLADGVFLRIGGEPKEVKVGVVGRLDAYGDWDPTKASYFATRREAEEFRFGLLRHALSRGVTRCSDLALISDGSEWIDPLGSRHYDQAVVIRDWYHVMGYVWKGAKALHGEETIQTARLVEQLETELWHGRVKELREALAEAAKQSPPKSEEAQKEYREVQVYLENQGHAMNYAAYREAGWPIGSGYVESACKGLVEARMGRPGMDWSERGADHLLFIRSAYYSKHPSLSYPPN